MLRRLKPPIDAQETTCGCAAPDLACCNCAKCVDDTAGEVARAREEAERKAWDSISRYKFEMFGYWASAWVRLNALLPRKMKRQNPFYDLVMTARRRGFGPPGPKVSRPVGR